MLSGLKIGSIDGGKIGEVALDMIPCLATPGGQSR